MVHLLSDDPGCFPNPALALPDGLLAVGGDLRPARLLAAYQQGIFPWFNEGEPPLWWCPDPRCVLFPPDLRISHSMKPLLRKNAFDFRVNTAFEDVMRNCQKAPRSGQDGTWITEAVVAGYTTLHRLGYAHSAEAWLDGHLVGGLYGVWLGKVFFGESMFSHVPNSSKFAFIRWVTQLQGKGVELIDCQVPTDHLLSLGATLIPRKVFLAQLEALISGKQK